MKGITLSRLGSNEGEGKGRGGKFKKKNLCFLTSYNGRSGEGVGGRKEVEREEEGRRTRIP